MIDAQAILNEKYLHAAEARAYDARPSTRLRPRLFIAEDQWCALYGDDQQGGIAGFGKSPEEAYEDFDLQWHEELPEQKKEDEKELNSFEYDVVLEWLSEANETNTTPEQVEEDAGASANASLICHAVNMLPKLVKALQVMQRRLDNAVNNGFCMKYADAVGGEAGALIADREMILEVLTEANTTPEPVEEDEEPVMQEHYSKLAKECAAMFQRASYWCSYKAALNGPHHPRAYADGGLETVAHIVLVRLREETDIFNDPDFTVYELLEYLRLYGDNFDKYSPERRERIEERLQNLLATAAAAGRVG